VNPTLEQAIKACIDRAKHPGTRLDTFELINLQLWLTVRLPHWYIRLLSRYPLAGLCLDYPVHGPAEMSAGHLPIQLAEPKDIYREMQQCYPGTAIRKLGYVCFGIDPTGSGDPYFMKVTAGENPPVFQVYHDVSRIGEEIERKGMRKIAGSLTEFFNDAKSSSAHPKQKILR